MQRFWQQYKHTWVFLTGTLGVLLLSAILFSLKNPVALDDGLRHAMMGKLMAEEGIFAVRGWSHWFFTGYFQHHIVDPWFLSNVLYVPLAGIPVANAVDIFAVISTLLLISAFIFCLRFFRVSPVVSALLVLVLLFGHHAFTLRLLLGRPFTIITVLTLLLLPATLHVRYFTVALLLFVLTLMSHLFVFPLAVTFIGAAIFFVQGRRGDTAKIFLSSSFGTVAGILLHPSGFEYVRYLWLVFLRIPLMHLPDRGLELYGGLGTTPTLYALAALGFLGVAVLYRQGGRKNFSTSTIFLLALVLFFLPQFFLWVRAIDFLWPILLLFVGVVVSHPEFLRTVRENLIPARYASPKLFAAVTLLYCGFFALNFCAKLRLEDASHSLTPYKEALQNVPEGARVLNTSWHYFPPLVSVRPDLLYAFAFDPAFLEIDNPTSAALLRMFHEVPADLQRHIDATSFIQALLKEHPADYVLFSRRIGQPVADALMKAGYTNVSGHPDWTLLSVR